MMLQYRIEYAVAAALLGLCRVLPERAICALFRGIARPLFHLMGSRKKLCLRNLEIAFPEKSPAERRKLARKSYLNLAENMALNTLIMANRISNERLMQIVETDDWHKIDHYLASPDKGFLAITGHVGNWEILSQYAALRLGRPMHVIARKSNNPLLEQRIIRPLRERFGVEVFYKKNALMHIMKAINKGRICGLLIDQRLKPSAGGIMVDFFGKPAPATGSSALLQIRFGVTVQPAFMVKTAYQKYRLVIGDPIPWTDNGKPLEEQVTELTRIHQQAIEEAIRQYPDQWFWMHNRWALPKKGGA